MQLYECRHTSSIHHAWCVCGMLTSLLNMFCTNMCVSKRFECWNYQGPISDMISDIWPRFQTWFQTFAQISDMNSDIPWNSDMISDMNSDIIEIQTLNFRPRPNSDIRIPSDFGLISDIWNWKWSEFTEFRPDPISDIRNQSEIGWNSDIWIWMWSEIGKFRSQRRDVWNHVWNRENVWNHVWNLGQMSEFMSEIREIDLKLQANLSEFILQCLGMGAIAARPAGQ